MSEIRTDPIFGHRVIVAENRAERPHAWTRPGASHPALEACPFCPGQEAQTPHETLALRDESGAADAPGWRLRVIPNKYPAVERESLAPDTGSAVEPGGGVHEVIIESARHVASFTELTAAEATDVIKVFAERLASLAQEPWLRYALVFKNVGADAGASIEHTHSQLVALPWVPPAVASQWEAAKRQFLADNYCPICRMIETEAAAGERVVHQSSDWVVLAPFAGRVPFETWILPKTHPGHFAYIQPDEASQLAQMCQQTLACMESLHEQLAYNLILNIGPFDAHEAAYHHWRLEIIPRVASWAGFEWAAGCYINPVSPERAAEKLRNAW